MTKPAEMNSVAKRRDQHDRELLRETRCVRHHRARDDARLGRDVAHRCRRARSPRGTSPDRIRADRAAPSPRARGARSSTSSLLVEAACCFSSFEAGQLRRHGSPAILRVVVERLRDALAASSRIWRSSAAICALQFLDARMIVQQRGGLLGQLRPRGDTLFVQAADPIVCREPRTIRADRRA